MSEPVSVNYPDELADLMVGMVKIAEAEQGYTDAHNYFTGEVDEFFASAKLAARVAKTGSKFRVNVARKPVTSVTDRLEISAFTLEPQNDTVARVLATTVIEDNELALEFPEWLERLGELGDVYGFVWPGDDPGTVDIHFSGPRSCRAIYDKENPRKIAYVIKHWTEGTGARRLHRVNLYYFGNIEGEPGRVEKWATIENVNGTAAEHWKPWQGKDGTDEAVVENPYGQIVWHFRTGRPYGRPLHKEAYGPQDAINKLLVSLMNTVDFHLIPQRAALSEGDVAADDDDFSEFATEEDALSENLLRDPTDESSLRSGPGELWMLKNVKSLVQLPAADPKNFLDPAEFFMRMMAQVTDMPLHLFDPGGDQPSGDSRRQAEGSLTKKVGLIRASVERTAGGLLGKALEIIGYAGFRVLIEWAPAQQVDDAEGWQTAATKIENGVPVGQVLQEMGYEKPQVEEWLSGNAEQDLRRRVMLLAELAKASRDLGTAVSLGVLDEATVQATFAMLTAGTEGEPAPAE